jgi:hypothetical protein
MVKMANITMNILSNLIARYTIDVPTKLLDWISEKKNKLGYII